MEKGPHRPLREPFFLLEPCSAHYHHASQPGQKKEEECEISVLRVWAVLQGLKQGRAKMQPADDTGSHTSYFLEGRRGRKSSHEGLSRPFLKWGQGWPRKFQPQEAAGGINDSCAKDIRPFISQQSTGSFRHSIVSPWAIHPKDSRRKNEGKLSKPTESCPAITARPFSFKSQPLHQRWILILILLSPSAASHAPPPSPTLAHFSRRR